MVSQPCCSHGAGFWQLVLFLQNQRKMARGLPYFGSAKLPKHFLNSAGANVIHEVLQKCKTFGYLAMQLKICRTFSFEVMFCLCVSHRQGWFRNATVCETIVWLMPTQKYRGNWFSNLRFVRWYTNVANGYKTSDIRITWQIFESTTDCDFSTALSFSDRIRYYVVHVIQHFAISALFC